MALAKWVFASTISVTIYDGLVLNTFWFPLWVNFYSAQTSLYECNILALEKYTSASSCPVENHTCLPGPCVRTYCEVTQLFEAKHTSISQFGFLKFWHLLSLRTELRSVTFCHLCTCRKRDEALIQCFWVCFSFLTDSCLNKFKSVCICVNKLTEIWWKCLTETGRITMAFNFKIIWY